MLKQRIVTASILIPLVVLGTLFLSSQPFAVLSSLIFGYAFWEWTGFSGFKSLLTRVLCLVCMPLSVLLLLAIFQGFGRSALQNSMLCIVVGFWLLAFFSVLHYPNPKYILFWKKPTISLLSGCLVLIPAWFLLVALQHLDPLLVLYLFVLVWTADIAAYFAGRKWGCHLLARELSPSKTWEGVFGALVGGIIVILIGFKLLHPSLQLSFLTWFMLGILTLIASIVGDLFESLFKRLHHLKDSGSLLPGHGGVLDRIDSLTAAIPVFSIGFMLLI